MVGEERHAKEFRFTLEERELNESEEGLFFRGKKGKFHVPLL